MASSSPSASLCLLFLLFNRSTQRCSHATPHLGVQQGAQEHHGCAQPVPHRERVLEVEDGDDEAEELSERDHQRDGERSALCGENEDAADANILCDDVSQHVEPHYRDRNAQHGNVNWSALAEVDAVIVDVCGEEQEAWQRQTVIVEEGLLGVLSIFFIQHFLEYTHSCRHKQGESQHGDTYKPVHEGIESLLL